jgi:hypothetical protein
MYLGMGGCCSSKIVPPEFTTTSLSADSTSSSDSSKYGRFDSPTNIHGSSRVPSSRKISSSSSLPYGDECILVEDHVTAAHHPPSRGIVHEPCSRFGGIAHKHTLPRTVVKSMAPRLADVYVGKTAKHMHGTQIRTSTNNKLVRNATISVAYHTVADVHRRSRCYCLIGLRKSCLTYHGLRHRDHNMLKSCTEVPSSGIELTPPCPELYAVDKYCA